MHILLVYAAVDGREPAARLAELLTAMGATVADAREAATAPRDASLIALLTPAALSDRSVLTALQSAPAQGRPLLPLSAPNPAAFPTADDLARILEWRVAAPSASAAGPKYVVGTAINTTVGDHAVTVNTFGQGIGWSAAEVAQLVAALRTQPAGGAMSAAEPRGLFAGLQAQLQQVDRALQQGFALLLGRFDLAEQRILAPILARLDEQETALVAAVLDALDARAFPAAELGEHLAAIQFALAELNARTAHIRNDQLAAAVRHAAEIAGDPNLDVKHKLKVTIPILPAFLAYEGELELSSGLKLSELWRGVWGRLRRA